MKGAFFHTQLRFFMAKVPKIQCSTILRMAFFCKNKVFVTKKWLSKMTTEIYCRLHLLTGAYTSAVL